PPAFRLQPDLSTRLCLGRDDKVFGSASVEMTKGFAKKYSGQSFFVQGHQPLTGGWGQYTENVNVPNKNYCPYSE
ncbi:MAG: hypothetical protein ACYSTT_23410, partial [Planctomycetota bacterium]